MSSAARARITLSALVAMCIICLMWLTGPLATRFAAPPIESAEWESWWSNQEPLDAVAALLRLVTVAALAVVLLAVLIETAISVRSAILHSDVSLRSSSWISATVALAVLGSSGTAGATPMFKGNRSLTGEPPPTMEMIIADTAQGGDESISAQVITYTVQPGDSLWEIARRRVAMEHLIATSGGIQSPPTPVGDDEVRAYWSALVALNDGRDMGSVSGVLRPGQQIELPG